jgi:NAD(P)-dependent dehydrogenase (short-subunit alcohol dehydrogenase family)
MGSARLDGKVAIVTGGGGSIGAASAAMMAAEGASVVVADIDVDSAERAASEIRAGGKTAVAYAVDLSSPDSIQELIEKTATEFGGLDILFNNAAATKMARTDDAGVEDMDVAVWDATMRINLRGTMLACKFAIPRLRARGGGSVINTVSGSALTGDLRHTAYGASKAAIILLTKAVATQHGPDGIRCNAISPGFIASDDPERAGVARHADLLLAHNLVKRHGRPSDIAAAAVYLASEESGFITGQLLVIDGGTSAHSPRYASLLGAG